MSLVTHIDHIDAQPGVLSILVNVPGQIAQTSKAPQTEAQPVDAAAAFA